MEDMDEEDDKIRRSWQRARRDFQSSTYFQLSSSSRPLEPRVQWHQVLDDNFLFTVRESL